MSSKVRLGIALVLVAMLAVGAAGCQAIAEKAVSTGLEKATGVKVDESGKSVTITGKDGKSATITGSEGELPADLPSDVPTYEGTVKSGGTMEGNGAKTWTFTIIGSSDVKTVAAWYKDELTKKGWTVDSSTVMESDGKASGGVSAKKGDLSIFVTLSPDSTDASKTEIAAIVGQKAAGQ
jgi:hypothetical protein